MTILYGVLLLKRSVRPRCYRNVYLLLTLSDDLQGALVVLLRL